MKRSADKTAANADQKGAQKKDDKGKKDNKGEKKKGGKKNDKAKQANKAQDNAQDSPAANAHKRSCKCRIIVLREGLANFRIRVFSSLTKLA
jgi:hypothetical protein